MSDAPLLSHPDRSLSRHLDEVGQITGLILARHGSHPFSTVGLDAASVLKSLAGWHDIAKATSFFQNYIADPDAFEQRSRSGDPLADPALKAHTPLGAFLALRHWSKSKSHGITPGSSVLETMLLGLLMMLVVRGHHTRLPTQRKLYDTLDFPHLEQQFQHLDPSVVACHSSLTNALLDVPNAHFRSIKDEVVDRLIEALEYLGENPLISRIRYRLAVQFCFSCLLEADKALLIHETVVGYVGQPGKPIAATVVEDNPPSGEASPRLDQQRRQRWPKSLPMRRRFRLGDVRPRVLTLPTGLGKTRCAAAWAFHLRARIEQDTGVRPKIFIVLPFLSIIEQTARVYRSELLGIDEGRNDETLIVSHSLSVREYGDAEDEKDGKDRPEFALDTWRSDIVLTTFDQFLLALMDERTKHQQRFHNLCEAIIVLDEVQAFPCRLWHPVGHILRELAHTGGSRLLLMTATQPGLIGA